LISGFGPAQLKTDDSYYKDKHSNRYNARFIRCCKVQNKIMAISYNKLTGDKRSQKEQKGTKRSQKEPKGAKSGQNGPQGTKKGLKGDKWYIKVTKGDTLGQKGATTVEFFRQTEN
jgi:hypothetical protein